MSFDSRQQMNQELVLIESFSQSYRERFSVLIRELNTNPTPQTAGQSIRLCVEALNMLLDTQNQLASAVRSIASISSPSPLSPTNPSA